MTPWEIQGSELINCNCAYGCPCQFNALPTKGFCEAMGAIAIDKGHYGDVRLDGLKIAVVFQWPGPIHEGKGKCQPIVETKAGEPQREALLKIMSGQDTEPFATMFAVFATTLEKVFDPIFTTIEYAVDVDARRGKVRAEGVFELHGFEHSQGIAALHRSASGHMQGQQLAVEGRAQGIKSAGLAGLGHRLEGDVLQP